MNVVISYATKNLPWVDKTKAAIASSNVDVFIAEYDAPAGKELLQTIESAIRRCDLLVVLWSKEARESKYVREEVLLAKGMGKQIVPLVLDEDRNLPEFIKSLKYIDVTKNPETAFADLKKIVDAKASAEARQIFGVLLTILGICVAAA